MTTNKRSLVLAVPSNGEGGLTADRSGHFGKCDCFTLIEIGDSGPGNVRVVANPPHTNGGCLSLVELLASNGVTALLVGGIGGRPLAGFQAAGIDVYFDNQLAKVGEAVEAVRSGAASLMQTQQACGL
jgi:predicted Fe-Mo cluster-binding NifX family protein